MLTADAPAQPAQRRRLAYQPALDGLRALAVSVVVLYHLDVPWMRGGFMGVDAFFVLSGFLITSLLLEERRATGGTNLAAFWSRRARRLLPAMFVMIAVVCWYGGLTVPATSLGTLRWDGIAGVLYYANWHAITSGQSYFAIFTAPSPLTHLWSLAIEEQFYLVWPLVLAFVAARSRMRTMFAVCVAGVVAAQVVMIALYDPVDPSRAYYATPARMNTFLIGCALAVLMTARPDLARRVPRRVVLAVSVVALTLCVAAWTRGTASREFFWGGDTLFGLAFAAVLFSFQGGTTWARRPFELRPLVWLGGISYAVYLWHWPAIVFLDGDRTGLSGLPLDVLRVAVTVGIAVVSMRFLERPVRRSLRPVLRWVVPATVVTLVIILVTTAGATSPITVEGLRGERCPPPAATTVRSAARTMERRGVPELADLAGRTIAVVGDSQACSLMPGIDALRHAAGIRVGNGSVLGCGVVAEQFDVDGLVAADWRERCPGAARRTLAKVRGDADIFVWWSSWEAAELLVGGDRVPARTARHDELVLRRMETWLARDIPATAQVALVLGPTPISDGPFAGRNPATELPVDRLNRLYRRFAATHPDRVTLLDLQHFLCPDGPRCQRSIDGIAVRPDGTHLSAQSAGAVALWMAPQLDELGAHTTAGPRAGE